MLGHRSSTLSRLFNDTRMQPAIPNRDGSDLIARFEAQRERAAPIALVFCRFYGSLLEHRLKALDLRVKNDLVECLVSATKGLEEGTSPADRPILVNIIIRNDEEVSCAKWTVGDTRGI